MIAENTPEANKTLSRRITEDAWNQHQPSGGVTPDREGLKQWITACVMAFPDLSLAIEELIAEGDKVVTRWAAPRTHQGDFMGVVSSGRQVSVRGITLVCIAGGQVVEEWPSSDELGLLQQLGLIPAAPG